MWRHLAEAEFQAGSDILIQFLENMLRHHSLVPNLQLDSLSSSVRFLIYVIDSTCSTNVHQLLSYSLARPHKDLWDSLQGGKRHLMSSSIFPRSEKGCSQSDCTV